MWWQFLTYGFVHDPDHISHILFNMLGLWFLGRSVEELYGRAEFLRLYLVLVVVGGVVWAVVNDLVLHNPDAHVIGASGAVTGVVILFAMNFPRRTILLMFVLPMPAWVLGILWVAGDILGATGHSSEHDVAFSVHLAGAAFAALYFQQRWNFGRLLAVLSPGPGSAPVGGSAFTSPAKTRKRPTARSAKRGRSHPGKDPSRGRRQLDAQRATRP